MGQKTHPYAFRIGIVNDWKSRWFNSKDYKDLVNQDYQIRDFLSQQLPKAAVSRIDIERRDKGCSCPRLCSNVLSALMWSGPTSQQPPITLAPASSHSAANFAYCSGSRSCLASSTSTTPPGSNASMAVKPLA